MRLVLSQGHGRRWPSPSEIPNAVALPDVPTIAAYGFDLAVELLAAQKGFAVALATTLTPGKTA